MSLKKRIVPCLDVRDGRVVKGVKFQDLRDVGDPARLAVRYEEEGADEVVFLDITASQEKRATTLDVVRRTAEQLFIPLTVGGGIRSVDDIKETLRAGADKVSINTAALEDPTLLSQGAERFGSQCIVLAIDGKRVGDRWLVHTHGGSRSTDVDAVAWAAEGAKLGAGEILLTSMDRDGTREGYDLAFTRAVADAAGVPVIASGGCGSLDHMVEALTEGAADAALVASLFHDGHATVGEARAHLAQAGVEVRE